MFEIGSIWEDPKPQPGGPSRFEVVWVGPAKDAPEHEWGHFAANLMGFGSECSLYRDDETYVVLAPRSTEDGEQDD